MKKYSTDPVRASRAPAEKDDGVVT